MTFLASAHLTSGTGYQQHLRTGRHELLADEPESLGGTDAGPAPFQLVLSGLAACTAITFAMYAEKKGFALGPLKMDMRLDEEDGKRRITRTVHFDDALPAERRARLLDIAEKTPVTLALKAGFAIDTKAE